MATHLIETDVLVLGSGPGGYAAAFRLADLGLPVTLVEQYDSLGGVCLNVGCIPSKALLHVAKVMDEAAALASCGVKFSRPRVNAKSLAAWKDGVVKKLTGGLAMLAKQRKVNVMVGRGRLIDAHHLKVQSLNGDTMVKFKQAVIATGSEPVKLPFIPEDPRIFDSTGALSLGDIKGDLLVIGGGIIGLEMATVYRALGVKVTVVELTDQLITGCDPDIVKPLHRHLTQGGVTILLGTKVVKVKANLSELLVSFEGDQAPKRPQAFQQILVAVGRRPCASLIGCDQAGIEVDQHGYIQVDHQLRTTVPHIYAIGDIVGGPMLAHKATPQGRLVAEIIAGKPYSFDVQAIPSVAYTDPEVAWVGLTEMEAKSQGIAYEAGVFPWLASGRALSQERSEGITKLLFDPNTDRLLGAAIVGSNAGELIAECGLALEMGCDAQDIALTIHAHPTLSETVMLAAEMYEGTITDLYAPKKKRKQEH